MRKERIIFHDILYEGATRNNVTEDEAHALKQLHFNLADTDNFQMYTVEKELENPEAKALIKMELVENLTSTFQASEEHEGSVGPAKD
uniref:Uncharacterized protein n=1 Tax=Romanomermis culicivorax TaxID=13658 RepID=A0A915J302_ROMCU